MTIVTQPYSYQHRELIEPDWRRFPGWRSVTENEWRDPQWQRAHCVKNVAQLQQVLGDLLYEFVYEDLVLDQKTHATMSVLLPPQMLNTMMPGAAVAGPGSLSQAFLKDPVRRYMLPVATDRRPDWPSHPEAARDSLHESEMWVVEGLTHRYPNKVLAELVTTCPQYCGHCTRMDLVGTSTASVSKARFQLRPADRFERMIDYLRSTSSVRDVVVSGGDIANVPWPRLEAFVAALLEIDSIRDIRLASKALVGLPQHWLASDVLSGLNRLAETARARDVCIAMHTHANAAQSITPLVAEASKALLATGIRDVRNQGVLMAGVNDSPSDLLDLCFALLDDAKIMPYYFYLCDIIPEAEHWRIPLWRAQEMQADILGYLPGFATPRLVCDVPYVGKRWVHQAAGYDRVTGVSEWTRSYRLGAEEPETSAHEPTTFTYYDPVHTLPAAGQSWWRAKSNERSRP
jgi:lysine 2,3-aminomutase